MVKARRVSLWQVGKRNVLFAESRCCCESTLGPSLMVLVSAPGSPEDFIATLAGLFQTKQPGGGVNSNGLLPFPFGTIFFCQSFA